MWNLSFFQRVRLALVVIIALLLISGAASLWNLLSVNLSTSAVNERALPMLNATNQTQILLLQQVKGSALAFSSGVPSQIEAHLASFQKATVNYQSSFSNLQKESTAVEQINDEQTQELTVQVQRHYAAYLHATEAMFTSKQNTTLAQQRIIEEKQVIIDLIDATGAGLVELTYYTAPQEYAESMEVVEGFASGADSRLTALFTLLDEVTSSTERNKLEGFHSNFSFVISDSRNYFHQAMPLFRDFGNADLLANIDNTYNALSQRLTRTDNILAAQIQMLKQKQQARAHFEQASIAANNANIALDELRMLADKQFVLFQSGVKRSVNFGVASGVAVTAILIFLAVQLFKSMRLAIQSKVDDLSELNQLGKLLAISKMKEFALQATLHSLRAKWDADCAQVYMMNDSAQFELAEAILKDPEQPNPSDTIWHDSQLITEFEEDGQAVIQQHPNSTIQTRITLPLEEGGDLKGVIQIINWHRTIDFSDSDSEYVASIMSSLVTTLHAIKMRELIEEQNRNLEQKVLERTASLRQKNNDIANMMASLHQGLFTITEGGSIHSEYAAFLETIFETNNIAGRRFSELLFERAITSPDLIAQNVTAVDVMLGQDPMMYECNQHCLITELVVNFAENRSKLLELDWELIIFDGVIEKLMVTVRDVTELKALEAEARGQKVELQIIGEVLALAPQKFVSFQENALHELLCCQDLIAGNEHFELNVVEEIYRKLHTVKGNSRTYNLSQITDAVHDVEEQYSRMINGETNLWTPQMLFDELSRVDEVVQQYDTIFYDKLHGDLMMQKGICLDQKQVSDLLEEIRILTRQNCAKLPKPVQHIVSKTYDMLIVVDAKPLDFILDDVLVSIRSIAKQLNKASPEVDINNGNVLFHRELHNVLSSVFMHLLRNALDHGIEDVKERMEKGKPLRGHTSIALVLESDHVDIVLSDDGRGINLDKLYLQGVDNGYYQAGQTVPHPDVIANLIFDAGVSTADSVTHVSGRGVGMNAVKSSLEQYGASIAIELVEARDATIQADQNGAIRTGTVYAQKKMGCQAFSTRITIPQKYYSLPPDSMSA